ncbi:MAG: hypothetical protein K9M15_00105 [Candidatus Marinimicrobia bacterium]|nr:hypothetical protein [Candidatus Neomarinimicrobiota bacterium]
MKICWFLQRSFVRIGHAININLKEKHGIDNFCAFTQTSFSKNFLNSQNEIDYKAILPEEDMHDKYKTEEIDIDFLKQFEKEYGLPNLWPYIAVDRTMMYSIMPKEYPSDKPMYTHEEMLKILQVKAKAIISFLEKEKPDVVCFSVIGSLYSMLAFHIAKKMGIKTIEVYPPCLIKNLLSVSENYKSLTWVDETFKKIREGKHKSSKAEDAKKIIKEFREKPLPYHKSVYSKKTFLGKIKLLKFLSPVNLTNSILWFLHLCFKQRKDYNEERPLRFLIDRTKRKIRSIIGYSDLYDKIDESEDFCFFPLQSEPEMSLYVWGFYWINQLETIRHVARALPAHFKIYVKEHPLMFGFRPRKYYKELKKIPNLKLIHPKTPGTTLIKKSKIVVTVTSTPAWEAAFLKKPAISLGDVFFNSLPQIKNCRCPEELPLVIKNELENFEHNESELVNFVSAILEESVNVDLIDLWYEEKDFEKLKNNKGIKEFADLLSKKINLLTQEKPITQTR